MLNALENYNWRYDSASELVNMILAFIETRALEIFGSPPFLDLSESMVQLILSRNLEVPEIARYEFSENFHSNGNKFPFSDLLPSLNYSLPDIEG